MLKKFENALYKALESKIKKRLILLGTLAAFVLSVMMIPTELVLAKMLPGKNNDTFSIYLTLPGGSSIHQTQEVSECVVGLLQQEKESLDMEVFLGMGGPLDLAGLVKGSHFKNSENVAEIVVNLSKKHHREEPSYMMVQRIRPLVEKSCSQLYAGTQFSFVEPAAGPPVLAAVVAEIYGDDAKGIRHLAGRVEQVFKNTPGLVDVDVIQDDIYEKFEIRVDSVKIARSGLDVKQLNDSVYLAFEGMQISVKNSPVYDDQIPIYLSLSPQTKRLTSKSKEAIEAKLAGLKLMNSLGQMVPVTELVSLVSVRSNPMIVSKNLRQMSSVVAETDTVSQVYPLMDARTVIIQNFADEYEIEKTGLFNLSLSEKKTGKIYKLIWDGEMEVTLDTFVELGAAFIAALVLIFLLMVVYYKSFKLSAIVLLGSFLSIIGVILGHFIMDLFSADTFFLTATSLVGFIALIGISSRNSLLLLDFTKSLILQKKMPQREAIAYATATRAKPILLTAAAIILASTLLASDAVFGGLGVALIFGTISAVIASLVVVPVLMDALVLKEEFS
ncbi:MAG: efflux RND transporter permease subunit [Campylobacterales bacterium]|nr:efflux RND transporter permease subunit [Campylobacterales bacterium]